MDYIDDDYVVSVRKKKGQPNRGGGRANQSRGRGGGQTRGRGRGGGRGQSRGRGRGQGRGRGRGRGGQGRGGQGGWGERSDSKQDEGYFNGDYAVSDSARARGRGRPFTLSKRSNTHGTHSFDTDVRVPMQKLHMSSENQQMVMEMLRDLHGQDQQEVNSDEEVYEDYDEIEEDDEEYWEENDNRVVEEAPQCGAAYNWRDGDVDEGLSYYGYCKQEGISDSNPDLNPYAVNKLVRYGFDKKRCESALTLMDGDIGAALEYLLVQCFNLSYGVGQVKESEVKDDSAWAEIKQQREDEMIALQSIYDKNFVERIPNRVWIIKLDIPALDKLFSVQSVKRQEEVAAAHAKASQKKVCVFYKQGSCKKGSRCNYQHEAPVPNLPSTAHLTPNSGEPFYELEVRFPSCNQYPNEPPFLAFSSSNPSLPTHLSLSITDKLIQEARSLAESGVPAIFSLVSCLEDENVIRDICNRPMMTFSLPEPVITRYPKKPANESVMVNLAPGRQRENPVDEEEGDDIVEEEGGATEEEAETEPAEKVVVQRSSRKDILPRRRNPREVLREDQLLKDKFRKKQRFTSYKKMLDERQKLPAWSMKKEILELVRKNQVLVVSGMTGCGKTTQVPQFILDSYLTSREPQLCNLVCTQPRRISAVAVAGRVAEERTERTGGIVGYQIRLESVQSAKTRLLFCTTGIILRRLEGDPTLEGVSHIIIDEVHERSEESDFLMMVLRDLLPSRPDLKVILMSATVNADLFSDYFDGCPVIEIPGKVFPVEQFFLEDAFEFTRVVVEEGSPYARPLSKMNAVRDPGARASAACMEDQIDMDLQSSSNTNASVPASDKIRDENLSVKQLKYRYDSYSNLTVKNLAMMDYDKINYELIEALMEWFLEADHQYPRNGAILVFLPGFAEIQTLFDQLESSPVFGGRNKQRYKVIPLHSSLSSEDQQAVFSRPKEGVTKIVIATNIAETSITIDDVVCVIDGGRMKEKRYDSSKGMESLDMVWVSRANALQRKGRAGRVASGVCFHLFTSHRYDFHLRDQPIPEIQRAPLEQIVLNIKMLDLFQEENPVDVLNKIVEPPAMESIQCAIKRLQDLGALDVDGELTPLGYHLGSLPVDVRIGKLMLFGAIFRCLDPALTIAATLSFKSPFVSPFGKKEEATNQKLEFALGNSDHLTMLNGYKEWLEVKKKHGSKEAFSFCRENFLSMKTLQMLASMKQQFVELLSDIGFVREGLTVRDVERAARNGGDGVRELTGTEANRNSNNLKLVAAILVGALYPNVVKVMTPEAKFSQGSAGAVPRLPKPEELKFKTKDDGYVHLHPSSVNFQVRYYDSPYLVYHEKVKTSKVFIRDSTMVSVYPLLLFGGGNISVDLKKGNFVLSVDEGWIRFQAASHQIAELVKELRHELDELLEDKIRNPNIDLATCPRGSKIINTIVKLVSTQ